MRATFEGGRVASFLPSISRTAVHPVVGLSDGNIQWLTNYLRANFTSLGETYGRIFQWMMTIFRGSRCRRHVPSPSCLFSVVLRHLEFFVHVPVGSRLCTHVHSSFFLGQSSPARLLAVFSFLHCFLFGICRIRAVCASPLFSWTLESCLGIMANTRTTDV